ncbi:pyridoxal phosphate-dependent transferase [Schizothecium vesticola]|uniref:Pyridoxal phosphate-dependent transferase n=1 Tax=Schizothecium vesticola TaxID=314040 RepID=A0AA40EV23_9PEZI|nr:pyridoxal phosphate-dependent transferase [Schizothecium vesticola]
MAVKVITTEPGHSLAPEGPHTVTFHFPGWDAVIPFRLGDPKAFAKLRSIYPRFGPFFEVKQLADSILTALSLSPQTHGCLPFTDPHAFSLAQSFALPPSNHRNPAHAPSPSELLLKVVDIAAIRLYVVAYPLPKTKGVLPIWQNPGIGISTRLAASLLDAPIAVVPFSVPGDGDVSLDKLPPPTYLPEYDAHAALRERLVELMNRAVPGGMTYPLVAERDVLLFPSGMAAIYHAFRAVQAWRPKGVVVVLGAVFHSTYHLLEKAEGGFKHFGDVGDGVVGAVEAYAEELKAEGREVAMVVVEFPSNPLLECVDLVGLRAVANKHSFPLVIDDTIGSFANVDLLPVSDIIVTSLSKSFSGYANLLAGSLILSPLSPFHAPLSQQLPFHNALSSPDAVQLLTNSTSYLPRTATLNRNAAALAALFASHPLTCTPLYPPYLASGKKNYARHLRLPTPELPEPGYGCLLSVNFGTVAQAKRFYEGVALHKGPHLGAHETIVFNYNEAVFGEWEEEREYHAGFGIVSEQVRVAVGLEEEGVLVETVRVALDEVLRAGDE